MKNKYISGFLFFLILSTFSTVNGQIKIIKNLDAKNITQRSITINNKLYDKVQLEGAGYGQIIGDPELPVYHYIFYIPMNEKAEGVTFIEKRQNIILLDNGLLPYQHPIPTSLDKIDTTFDMPNKLVYESDEIYPTSRARICHTDYIDGDLKLVTVEVFPMCYYPKSKKIIFSSEFEIQLETIKDDQTSGQTIHPKKRNKNIVNEIRSSVENPEALTLDSISIVRSSLKSRLKSLKTTWSVPFYEYVVITSDSLQSAFSDLVAWKRQKGYNAGVVSIQDILSDPMATGDAVSNLTDDAGKLRQYLNAGYSAGITKYALLGGDYTVVPIRYGCGSNNNSWGNGGEYQIPSDLYFSDFNGNWNVDGDIYTGEKYGDAVDYAPEIYVGRLLCTTSIEISNWIRKQLKYEQNPGNGNYSYLNRVLFTQSDELQDGQEAETVQPFLPSGFQTTIIQETPSYISNPPNGPLGTTIISNINSNYYGLLCNFNHGCPTQYAVSTPECQSHYNNDDWTGIGAKDAYETYVAGNYYRIEGGNGFDNLTNYDAPGIFYSVSCTNMPFDDHGTYSGCKNLGETFTTNSGGGIAYIGNTRYGYVGSSSQLFKKFLGRLDSLNNLGKAEALSKIDYPDHFLALTHNLLGCPETPMWTAIPSLFTNVAVSLADTVLTVNTNVPESKICVTNASDNGISYFQVIENVSSYTFTGIPASYKVVVTKTNYIPYIYSSDCYIQNETFAGSSSFYGNHIIVGENVTTAKPIGNVVVSSGGNVSLKANTDVSIYHGFEVQSDGQFEIK